MALRPAAFTVASPAAPADRTRLRCDLRDRYADLLAVMHQHPEITRYDSTEAVLDRDQLDMLINRAMDYLDALAPSDCRVLVYDTAMSRVYRSLRDRLDTDVFIRRLHTGRRTYV